MKNGQTVKIIRGPYEGILGNISRIESHIIMVYADFSKIGKQRISCSFAPNDLKPIYPTQEDAEFAVSLVNYVNSRSEAGLSKDCLEVLRRLDGEKVEFFKYCFGEFSPWKTVLKSKKSWQVKLQWDKEKAAELGI